MYKKASDILENALVEQGQLKKISDNNKIVEKRITDMIIDRINKKTIFTIEILGSEKKLRLYPSEILRVFIQLCQLFKLLIVKFKRPAKYRSSCEIINAQLCMG